MNEAKEKTALCTSVGADERQSVQNTISSISALDTEINHPDENSPENFEDIDNDGNGCLTFEVNKGRFGFKLTAPYSEERRKAASELAKKNTERLRRQEQ